MNSFMKNQDPFQAAPRYLAEEGRQHMEEDIRSPQWKEHRFLQDRWNDKIQLWRPCAKKKSFENGAVFVFRMVPTLPTSPQQTARFLPARYEDGIFSNGTVRGVGTIDNFGFGRKISFIPSIPFTPERGSYQMFTSPNNNPYSIMKSALWRKKECLPDSWAPLTMKVDEITAYRKTHRLVNKMKSTLLLPMLKMRYFAYGIIYRGHNIRTEEDFEFENRPYGLDPDQGLQVVTFNDQAFADLRDDYIRPKEPGSEAFYFPDPSAPGEGTLNYIWNREFPNPVNPRAGKRTGFGYAGAAETRYFLSPSRAVNVDLTLPDEFLDFYYAERQPWSSVLRGTYGTDQVRMIAEIAPELKGPCKLAWQDHRELMEAWEEAFQYAPDDCDFHEVLRKMYSTDESSGESARYRDHRSVESSEFAEQGDPVDVPGDDEPDQAGEQTVDRFLHTRSRITTPDSGISKPLLPPVAPAGKPSVGLKSPLKVLGGTRLSTPAPAGFNFEENQGG